MSADNVVSEVFSWVTAKWVPSLFSYRGVDDSELIYSSSHKEITEAQCNLLMSNSRDPKTIALVKENIGHIFDGSLPHCADLLNLGLKKAFDLKKQERQPSVMLRCWKGSCSQYNRLISYSTVASDGNCRTCGCILECADCRADRRDNRASCERCGKRFV